MNETQEQEIIGNSGSLSLTDGIRLRKTQKGYTWDICVKGFDLKKLEEVDNELKEKWGDIDNEDNEE